MPVQNNNSFISSFSMKKFLKITTCFFLPIVLLAFPLDFFLSKNLRESKARAQGEFLVWNDIYDGKINAEVTVNGSSRAWLHFDPAVLENGLHRSVYNIGIDGHSFPLQDFRFRELKKHNKPPKFILYSVDIFTLTRREELYNYEQFLPYMLMDTDIYNATKDYKGFKFWDFYLPLIRYAGNGEIINAALRNAVRGDNSKPARIKGYKGNVASWNNDLEKAKAKMKSLDIELIPEYIAQFDTFLATCRDDGTKVVLVYTPEEIEGQKFIKNREAILSMYRGFAKKYNLVFLDYSRDAICYDKKYFYNALHLNKTGSELFSHKLVEDLKKTNARHGMVK
jgi:hypothetical protein